MTHDHISGIVAIDIRIKSGGITAGNSKFKRIIIQCQRVAPVAAGNGAVERQSAAGLITGINGDIFIPSGGVADQRISAVSGILGNRNGISRLGLIVVEHISR